MTPLSVAKGCVVHGPWPTSLAQHVRVLINPANDALIGPKRPVFPRGGPVPPPPPKGLGTSLGGWGGMDAGWDMLYPAQTVDGLVHMQGGPMLRAALVAAAPVLETRQNGEHLRCRVGDAVLTSGIDGTGSSGHSGLPFDAIVHTVPPFWPRGVPEDDFNAQEEWATALRSCYDTSFRRALAFVASRSVPAAGLAIATPVLGSGARGAPFAPAARILAEAAVAHFGADRLPGALAPCLRVVVHSASMSAELATLEDALEVASTRSSSHLHSRLLGDEAKPIE